MNPIKEVSKVYTVKYNCMTGKAGPERRTQTQKDKLKETVLFLWLLKRKSTNKPKLRNKKLEAKNLKQTGIYH